MLAVLALVGATAIMWATGDPATAGPANHLDLRVLDKTVTAGKPTAVVVEAQDFQDNRDTDYTGAVTFTASCGNCFSVAPHDADANATYTFSGADNGLRNFTVVWFTSAIGERTLTVKGTELLGDPDDAEGNIVVSSNDATSIDLRGVETSVRTGTETPAIVEMFDANGELAADYNRHVTFGANCGPEDTTSCFLVSPNDGGENSHRYTFTPADQGDRRFTLVWQQPGKYTLTATALLPGNATASDRQENIEVGGTGLSPTTTVASTTTAASPLAAILGGETTTTTAATTTTAGGTSTTGGGATSTTSGTAQAAALSCDDPRSSTATVTPNSAEPGDDVAVRGACFAANQQGLTIRFSNPARQLGTTSSDANGRYTTVVRIPADAVAGRQTITISGPGGRGGTHDSVGQVTVVGRVGSAGGILAKTGRGLLMLGAAGALVFILGHTITALGRRLES